MFTISSDTIQGLRRYKITHNESGEFVAILPDAGCGLNNFVIRKQDSMIDLVDGYTSQEDLQQKMHTFFKGHFLFPFPNRIYGGLYTFQGKHYALKKNFAREGNAIHGLLYDKPFELFDQSVSGGEGRLSFQNEMEGFEGYPFKCSVTLHYVLSRRKLSVSAEIVNTGEGEMPAAMGWHPYFTFGGDISEIIPEAHDCDLWHQETMSFVPVDYLSGNAPFADKVIDGCFRQNKSRNIVLKDREQGLMISVETGKDLRYFQLFTPPHRKSIAIEPMTCVPDCFNNKIGFKTLSVNERWQTGWSVEVQEIL